MITGRNITASHRGRRVIHGIDITVGPGVLNILLGPNASGKTSLIRCLAALHRPDSGEVRLNNRLLAQIPAAECRRCIAYVPQDNPMAFAYTVAELVGLGQEQGDAHRNREILGALAALDLEGLEQRNVLTLSGGERQRAAIARAIAQNTDYLLLDEPTAHLDLRHQKMLLDALLHLAHQENKGILLALHDLNLAAAYADRLILLQEGRIAAEGRPAQVLTTANLRHVYGTEAQIEGENEARPRVYIFPQSNDLNFS